MITHEEARERTLYLHGKYDEAYKTLNNYISQQEKITELLDLYRNFQYHVYSGNVSPRDRLNEKIQKLEKELKEWQHLKSF